MKLIIFDLDQTLVDVISVHDETMPKLFKKHFGVSARLTEVDFAGRSLTDNFIELARLKGIPEDEVRSNSQELLKEYESLFAESMPADAARFVLPGAKELLLELSKTDNLVALYTGSSAGVVREVLRVTGLGRYFKFALSATEAKSRADMVRQAVERAEGLTGKTFKDRNIVIIGDSVRDIDCGKQFGAVTIAIATGFHSREQLLGRQPDYLFENLKDYKRVLKAIG